MDIIIDFFKNYWDVLLSFLTGFSVGAITFKITSIRKVQKIKGDGNYQAGGDINK